MINFIKLFQVSASIGQELNIQYVTNMKDLLFVEDEEEDLK